MAEKTAPKQDIKVEFVRNRDYQLVRELGQGACGKTVLLYDDLIDEHFVCKKYVPYSETERQSLYTAFVREIKLLHKLHHDNVVRVFNYYLYPQNFTGYILMEFVDGVDVEEYLKQNPERANEVFLQSIAGFSYLERSQILHRDVRPANLMVTDKGVVKIIDLGFGKQIRGGHDFDKSISLNWWCEPPSEFSETRYDFQTEVYFVGKLFQRIIQENSISHFKHGDILARMCHRNPTARISGFADVEKIIRSNPFFEIEFEDDELLVYRTFADAIKSQVSKIERGCKYHNDLSRIQNQLGEAYRTFMLEDQAPDAASVLNCFLNGNYYYRSQGLAVFRVKSFLELLKSTTEEKGRIILANLHTKLDTVSRYSQTAPTEDEIPF